MKDSFVFYKSFFEAIEKLPEECQLEAYRSITKLALFGEDEEPTGLASIVYIMAKPQIEANFEKYENGRKGGAPKGNKNAKRKQPMVELENNQKQPVVDLVISEKQPPVEFKNNKKQPNVNVNVNDNVNDNDNVNVNDNGAACFIKNNDEEITGAVIEYSKSEPLRKALFSYVDMRKQMGVYTIDSFIQTLKRLDSFSSDDKVKEEILMESVRNSWKDIYELKNKTKKESKESKKYPDWYYNTETKKASDEQLLKSLNMKKKMFGSEDGELDRQIEALERKIANDK